MAAVVEVRRRNVGAALLVATVCILISAAAAFALTGTFKGKTSQHLKATIKVAGGTILYSSSTIHSRARCSKGSSLSGSTRIGGKIKHGRWSGTGTYTSYPGGPIEAKNTVSISVSFSGHSAKGTFRLKSAEYFDGTLYARCKTGKVTFTASR